MSLIMTASGWKQLQPTQCTELPSSAMERSAYTGGFPSRETCMFINEMKSKMLYFDDGLRMKYTKYAAQ